MQCNLDLGRLLFVTTMASSCTLMRTVLINAKLVEVSIHNNYMQQQTKQDKLFSLIMLDKAVESIKSSFLTLLI